MRLATMLHIAIGCWLLFSANAFAVDEEIYSRSGLFSVAGDGPNVLQFSLGAFDVQEIDESLAGQLEWRLGCKYLFVGPAFGLLVNTDGGALLYGQAYTDLGFDRFRAVFAFGAGAYNDAGSKDLGGVFQLISSVSIGYQFDNYSRAGLRYSHISNGGTYDRNPGVDPLLLFYEYPF